MNACWIHPSHPLTVFTSAIKFPWVLFKERLPIDSNESFKGAGLNECRIKFLTGWLAGVMGEVNKGKWAISTFFHLTWSSRNAVGPEFKSGFKIRVQYTLLQKKKICRHGEDFAADFKDYTYTLFKLLSLYFYQKRCKKVVNLQHDSDSKAPHRQWNNRNNRKKEKIKTHTHHHSTRQNVLHQHKTRH